MHDGTTARERGWDELVDSAAGADVVVVGEMHGNARGLAATGALWQELTAASGEAALALEFLERDAQLWLDDYLLGISDEHVLRRSPAAGAATGDHAPLVEWARSAGRKVYAANAPRRYVTLVRKFGGAGLDVLTPEQRGTVVLPTVEPTGGYRERFATAMGGVGHGKRGGRHGETVEDYYRAQLTWDATMADTVARAVDAGHRPVVLVVGRFHSDYRGGVVQMIEHRLPDAEVLTVSLFEAGDPNDLFVPGRADWLLDVSPRPVGPDGEFDPATRPDEWVNDEP